MLVIELQGVTPVYNVHMNVVNSPKSYGSKVVAFGRIFLSVSVPYI